LNGDSKVNIDIYSQNGRLINTLVNQTLPTGVYSYSWNYEDKNGKKVNDGVYFIKIRTSQFEQTKKLIVAN
jgi:flagellar hook assembly protein FlgD